MARKPLTYTFLGFKATEQEIAECPHLLVKTEYGYMHPPDKPPQRVKDQWGEAVSGYLSKKFSAG